MTPITPLSTPTTLPTERHNQLGKTAQAFESMILSQMLSTAGLNRVPDAAGGGPGEEQFASFLTEAQAKALAERGGIGIAERLIRAFGRPEVPHG